MPKMWLNRILGQSVVEGRRVGHFEHFSFQGQNGCFGHLIAHSGESSKIGTHSPGALAQLERYL